VHKPTDTDQLATCRAHIEAELGEQLDNVAHLIENGKTGLLTTIDMRYGGLTAPRSTKLANRLDEHP
jgi:hypothetical protein